MHLKARMRHIGLLTLLTLLPIGVRAQERQDQQKASKSIPRTEAWVGCWVLRATNDQQVAIIDSVRLERSVIPHPNRTLYRGHRLPEKPGYFTDSVSWSLGQHGDSAEVRVEALGGTVWHLVQDRDSAIGRAYETFDIVPGEHLFGLGTARRLKCKRPERPNKRMQLAHASSSCP